VSPTVLEIAAIVHNGAPSRTELAQRLTLDRLIRYGARLADERKAARFAVNNFAPFEVAISSSYGGIPTGTVRWLCFLASVDLTGTISTSGFGAVFETSVVLGTPKDQIITLPTSARWKLVPHGPADIPTHRER
jgi:hypothetical protein